MTKRLVHVFAGIGIVAAIVFITKVSHVAWQGAVEHAVKKMMICGQSDGSSECMTLELWLGKFNRLCRQP